jgi:hypothetical protein
MHDAAPSIAALVHYRLVPPTATWGGSEMSAYPNWESVSANSPMSEVYILNTVGTIDVSAADAATNNGTVLTTELITGDRDFDAPDDNKTFYRLALKLNELVTSDLVFACAVSNDRGQNWKNIGNLVIHANDDEGQVNFRMRGSMCRFRLVGINNYPPYTVNEITMDVRGLGKEVAGREDQ